MQFIQHCHLHTPLSPLSPGTWCSGSNHLEDLEGSCSLQRKHRPCSLATLMVDESRTRHFGEMFNKNFQNEARFAGRPDGVDVLLRQPAAARSSPRLCRVGLNSAPSVLSHWIWRSPKHGARPGPSSRPEVPLRHLAGSRRAAF